MKILQINAVYGMGSTGRIVRDISDGLIEQGHESYVMWATGCRTRDGKKEANLIRVGNLFDRKLHAVLRRIDGTQGNHSRFVTKRACKKIKKISPNVVHLHNLHSNYIHLPTLLSFLTKHNIPTLITMHDCWFLSGYCAHYMNFDCQAWKKDCANCPAVGSFFRKRVQKTLNQRRKLYDAIPNLSVNGVSEWTTEAVRESILKSAKNIQRIYNWIDTDVFTPKKNTAEIKKKYGILADRKLILGVSQSWGKEKGVDSFVCLAESLSDIADIILVGADSGVPKRDNLRCIGFTANVEELIDLYSAADVLVNASSVETFGLVTVEAMACGTPVVAYDNSGSSELIAPNCGALVEDGNMDALSRATRELLSQEKATFIDACREHVCKNFEKKEQIQEYIKFYQKISELK